MKKVILTTLIMLAVISGGRTQTVRYFEFRTSCGGGIWQDTAFIASATGQALIDSVLANLARPVNQRKFISGPIAPGHGGYNHNATHWFLWHFIQDQWGLTEMATEACDGCPYSDVDADTSYWIRTVGYFCPWSGKPAREVTGPSGFTGHETPDEVRFFPNPASDKVFVDPGKSGNLSVEIFSATGQKISACCLPEGNRKVDISGLQSGFYFFRITSGKTTSLKKLVIDRD